VTCNLLLVDDHSLIEPASALVQDIPGYAVIGEASDGAQLLEQFCALPRYRAAGHLDEAHRRPGSIATAASRLPQEQGADPVDAHRPGTDHARAGVRAHGYLLKDTTATELEHALLALRNNERYLSPAIAHTVINQALVRGQSPTTPAGHVTT
jgi:DNA-binding NarL/FixJ family response regulator